MNMPKDTKGTGPEDVEAHAAVRPKRDAQGEEPRLSRDTSEDVEAHGAVRSKRDAEHDR